MGFKDVSKGASGPKSILKTKQEPGSGSHTSQQVKQDIEVSTDGDYVVLSSGTTRIPKPPPPPTPVKKSPAPKGAAQTVQASTPVVEGLTASCEHPSTTSAFGGPTASCESLKTPQGGGEQKKNKEFDDGASDTTADSATGTYTCGQCHCGSFYKSQVFVFSKDPSFDWQGVVPLICRVCWNWHASSAAGLPDFDDLHTRYDERPWSKKCGRQWLLRVTNNKKNYVKRVRVMNWSQALAEVPEVPGQSQRLRRLAMKNHVVHMVAAFTKSFERWSPNQSAQADAALTVWEQEHKRKAEDPEYVPTIGGAERISDYAAQFMSEITPGIHQFYMCRQSTCLLVCRNTDWINTVSGGTYKCHGCGERYQPWKQSANVVKTNMVIILGDEVASNVMQDAVKVLGEVDPRLPLGESHFMIPLEWPHTAETNLMNRFKEITLDLDTKMESMRGDDKAQISFITKTIQGALKETFFSPIQTSSTIRTWIHDENQAKSDPNKRFDLENCWKDTIMGTKLDIERHQLNSPLSQDQFITIWGMCKYYKVNVR